MTFDTLATDDGEAVEFIIRAGGHTVHARLDARMTDSLIAALGAARQQIAPEIPRSPGAGGTEQAVADPVWIVPHQHSAAGKLLGLRHPAFGWLWFQLPEREALAIGAALETQRSQAQPAAVN